MARKGVKCKTATSDLGLHHHVENNVVSSDGSVGSSSAKIIDVCPDDLQEKCPSPGKSEKFLLDFVDLLKNTTKSMVDGSCQFIKPTDYDILAIDFEDVDKVEELWGF